MKNWKDVAIGDVIYYYDHCKIHSQVVKDVQFKEWTKTYKDYWNHNRIITEKRKEIVITAGRNSEIHICPNEFGSSILPAYRGDMRRFSCKEAAEKFLKGLVDFRIKKAKKLDDELNKQLKIIAKYENFNTNFKIK